MEFSWFFWGSFLMLLTQRTRAWDTQQATLHPQAHLASVSKAPRLSLLECATDLTCIFISVQEPHKNRGQKEGKCQTMGLKRKQTNKKSRLLPGSDHLFGILSPWRCSSTKNCDKRAFPTVLKKKEA